MYQRDSNVSRASDYAEETKAAYVNGVSNVSHLSCAMGKSARAAISRACMFFRISSRERSSRRWKVTKDGQRFLVIFKRLATDSLSSHNARQRRTEESGENAAESRRR